MFAGNKALSSFLPGQELANRWKAFGGNAARTR
jgi:hypothetical protein